MKYIMQCFLWKKTQEKDFTQRIFYRQFLCTRLHTAAFTKTFWTIFLKYPSFPVTEQLRFLFSFNPFFDKVPSQVSVVIPNGTSERPKRNKNLSSHQFSLYRCLCGVKIREWSVQWSVECKVWARKAQWKLEGNVELNVQRKERVQIVEYPVMVVRCAVWSSQFLLHRGSSTENSTQKSSRREFSRFFLIS